MRASPVINSSPLYVSRTLPDGSSNPNPIMGAIGVAVNGIPVYNDANAEKADAYVAEGHTFDDCRGHADFK